MENVVTEEDNELQATYMRQRDIYDPEINHKATVIGCGSLGSYIAMALAKLGMQEMVLWDFDEVELHNLPNQVFTHDDMNYPKAYACKNMCQRNSPRGDFLIDYNEAPWTPHDALDGKLIINAPDSIDVRKQVMEKLPKNAFVVDVRSGGESFQVYCADTSSNKEMEFYREQFFDAKKAKGTDCTARATVHTSMMIASMAVDLYIRWVNREPYPNLINGHAKNFVFTPFWIAHKLED